MKYFIIVDSLEYANYIIKGNTRKEAVEEWNSDNPDYQITEDGVFETTEEEYRAWVKAFNGEEN